MGNRPVVFVPGFPASHLRRAGGGDFVFLDLPGLVFDRAELLPLLMGPEDLADATVEPAHPIAAGANVLGVPIVPLAGSLYDVLRTLGYDTDEPGPLFRALGWDWRKPVDDDLVLTTLATAIRDLERDGGLRPVAIVHSTGGLVLRALLEAEPELADHLHSVIAFGVPWGGTLRTLPYLLGRDGFGPVPADETQLVMATSWAAWDLLPPATANAELRLVTREQVPPAGGGGAAAGGGGAPVDLLAPAERTWFVGDAELRARMGRRADRSRLLHAGRRPEIDVGGRSLPITNVTGFGSETLLAARVATSGEVHRVEGLDDDGLDDGDGTVPRRSAAWLAGPTVRTFELPLGFYPGHYLTSRHDSLWKNPGGQDLLWTLLADEPWRPFVHLAFDDGDVNSFAAILRLRLVALDRDGAPLASPRVTFSGLTQGKRPELVARRDGRAQFLVPRERIHKTGDGRFRRLTVKVTWDGAAAAEERSFLLPA
jgi:hypothetical protein